MPFSLSEKDFGACKESRTKNYVAPVRRKFAEELKPQLVGALGERFNDFVTTGKHSSPYVARVRSRSRGGYYRGHMWLGMAHKKYSDPRKGVQLQFGIDSDCVFSFGIWFEDNAMSAKKEASQRITDRKEKFIELLKALGDDYSISASIPNDEKTAKANEVKDKDLDILIPLLAGDQYYFQILRDLSREAAIQMGEAIAREIANTFTELLPLYYFLAGVEMSPQQNVKTETITNTKEDLNGAIIRFKADPRVKLWKDLRLVAYKKFRERFGTDKLDKLTKADFSEFLDCKTIESWSGLQQNKPKIVADMEELRKALAYLQREEVSVDQRLFEVLVKKDGDLRINGMSHDLVTAILQVCDETDRYGVWNERSETTLRRFGLIPSTLPSGQNEAYIVINKSLNDLKEAYGLDLTDVDLFLWWVDELDGKALLWSVNTEGSPDVIKIHQEHIKTMGATYWGVGFRIKKDEFGFPSELPLPLEGYLYEKGSKVNFHAKIESIESYEKKQPPKEVNLRPQPYARRPWKTYLKISRLETLARPMDISELRKWKDRTPVKRPPQGYTVIVNPALVMTGENRLSSNLDMLFKPLRVSFEDLQFEGLMFEDEKNLKEQIHAALNSGKNIMLVGPPGTGKTEIARSLGKMAKEKGYINDYVLTTATSDWTTFDTMGGYVPSKDGKSLQFRPGQFLRCFKEGNNPVDKWLIIDEINRADIDKAFGQLFTVLSGQDVQLPFVTECASGERSVEVMPSEKFKETGKTEISENEYIVPSAWRLIGTLNTYDKASLYQMSYAFMRRFVFIYVGVPSPDFIDRKWEGYLHEWKIDSSGLEYCLDSVKRIWEAMNKGEGKRPIGPAIMRDLLQSIVGRKKGDGTTQLNTEDQKEILTDTIASFLLPQFEGLENTELLQQELMKYCAPKIVRRFKEMVGG